MAVLPIGVLCMPSLFVRCRAEESVEQLHRRTVRNWKSSRSYDPWNEFADALGTRWQNTVDGPRPPHRLPLVGGFEEGILAIERASVAQGEGADAERDRALSRLYGSYGQVLLDLTAVECRQLALDPHTLLMGIDKVAKDGGDAPSTYLCVENAENALRNAASLDATNAAAQELLETITGGDSAHRRKPMEFVAELFDSFAETFDEKLVKGLEYVVPQLVGKAAKALRPRYGAILDAGCGTGLAGRYLKPLLANGIMVGVDASQKMLDIAAKCTTRKGCGLEEDQASDDGDEVTPLYEDLLRLDLEDMTLENTLARGVAAGVRGFDLIVAADVLVYFGSLSNLLTTFASLSADGAGLVFSCERAEEEEAPLGWRLLPTGRFSHTKRHVTEAATEAGYRLMSYEEIVPRMEKGEEVRGHLFAFALHGGEARSEL